MPMYHPSPNVTRAASQLTEEEQVKIAKRIGLIQHLPTGTYDGCKKNREWVSIPPYPASSFCHVLTVSSFHSPLKQMCDMHGWIYGGRFGSIPAVHAHLPRRVYRRLANEELHLPVVHGTGRIGSPFNLRSQLRKIIGILDWNCSTFQSSSSSSGTSFFVFLFLFS